MGQRALTQTITRTSRNVCKGLEQKQLKRQQHIFGRRSLLQTIIYNEFSL